MQAKVGAIKFKVRYLELRSSTTLKPHECRREGMIWENDRDAPPPMNVGHKKLKNVICYVGTTKTQSQIFQDKCKWLASGSRNPSFD
jgi:hypothetical protein